MKNKKPKHELGALSPSKLTYALDHPKFEYADFDDNRADVGTRLHRCIEQGHVKFIKKVDQPLVQACIEFIHDLGLPAGEAMYEVPIEVLGMAGTADFFAGAPDGSHWVAVDWKFGHRRVPPPEVNPQIWCYAVGLMKKFSKIPELHFYVFNPRVGQRDCVVIQRGELDVWQARIADAVARVSDPAVPCAPGDVCALCKHLRYCSYAKKEVEALVPAEQRGEFTLDLTTPENRSRAQSGVRILEAAAKLIKDANREWLESGNDLPGYKLSVSERSVGGVSGAAVLEAARGLGLEITAEDVVEIADKLPKGAVEKLVKGAVARGKGKAAVDKFWDAVAENGGAPDTVTVSRIVADKK